MKSHYTLYIILATSCVLLASNTNSYQGDLVEPTNKPFKEYYTSRELDFLTLGDWGYEGTESCLELPNQVKVALAMEEWAEDYYSDFILNTGDNFYISYDGDHEGVTSVDDPKWDRIWKGVYNGRLARIPWYNVVGNHDWYNNVTAQVDYSLNRDSRFFLPSTYYVRESYFGPYRTKIAWIHIDTDIFFYDPGELEEKERVLMKEQFEQFGWNNLQAIEEKLKWIEDRLIEQQDSKWIFVVGHHPLVGECAQEYFMKRLRPLFEKHRVTAYFSGHAHTLELETAKPGQPVTYFLSGAGSKTDERCDGEDWGAQNGVLGFLHSIVSEDEMYFEFIDSTTLDPKVIYRGKIFPRPMF